MILTLVLALALAACGCKATPAPTDTPVPTPTATPEPTVPAVGGVDIALGLVTQPTGANVATVNGIPISSEYYMRELELQLISITEYYGVDWSDATYQAYIPQFEMQVFEDLINRELWRQLAEAEGIQISQAALDAEIEATRTSILTSGTYTDWANFLAVYRITEEYFRESIHKSLVISELIKAHGGPTEAEHVWAQHILVDDEDTAKKVLEELNAGKTFEELAAEYSTDTGSKDLGGDLGWFPRGMMVTEFEDAAFALAIGDVSQPVETDFGFHIIKVLGKEVRPLDEYTLQQVQEQAFSAWFAEQRSTADVVELLAIAY
jgi:foldase protein PrsA